MTARPLPLVLFALVALLQPAMCEARATAAPAEEMPAELQPSDAVSFALPGTQHRHCGTVRVLVDFAGARYAWVESGQLVARLRVDELRRGARHGCPVKQQGSLRRPPMAALQARR